MGRPSNTEERRQQIVAGLLRVMAERGWALRTWLIGLTYFLISAIISLPWGIYQEWGFEKSYGRTSQPLGDFLMQDAIGTLLSSVLGVAFLTASSPSASASFSRCNRDSFFSSRFRWRYFPYISLRFNRLEM